MYKLDSAKVLNIMLSRELGGIQQAFLDYDNALKLQNIEVINVSSFMAKINKFVKPISYKLPYLSPLDFFSRFILKYIIYKTKPDIIIAHGTRAMKFSKFAKSKKNLLIGVSHNYSTKGLKKCDYIISLTNHMTNYLLQHNFLPSQILTLPNMINVKKDFINKIYKTPVRIGMISRLVPKKGADIFIRAIDLLKKQGYELKAIIGGDGEEKEQLIALTRELLLTENIIFSGWIKDKESFFNDIDIFCIPSLHEPFGIVVLEAMESGIPIVSTKTEGPSEILEDRKEALLCDINSAEDLAKKIAYFIDNPIKAQEFSQAAYLKLKNNYDLNVVSKKLGNFCKSILAH